MRRVPTQRLSYASDRRLLMEYLPSFIGNFRPIPTGRASQHPSLLGCQIRNEIRREAEIVGAAPSGRFRDTFGDKASLSAEMSETLEDFEAVLKATGLMDRREVLVQYATAPRKFRVQRLQGVLGRDATADRGGRYPLSTPSTPTTVKTPNCAFLMMSSSYSLE